MTARQDPAETGVVLLTGGSSSRFGAPKHLQAHPEGGSWGSFLVRLFQAVLGDGPIRILGEPVAECPDLPRFDDPREGPARALTFWAAAETRTARRWWVVACDQVRWDPASLAAWHEAARRADPAGEAWVLPEILGERQPLGGFLGGALLPSVGRSTERRMHALTRSIPTVAMRWEAGPFLDLDDPEAVVAWLRERRL